ncbi:MAG: hypothetical protein IPL79_03955 [Myxococcales bacterium]|nr:hypothetical protein [Myxococcales bacterium]
MCGSQQRQLPRLYLPIATSAKTDFYFRSNPKKVHMTFRNMIPVVSLLATTLSVACIDPALAPCDGAGCEPALPTCGDGEISASSGEACDDHNTQDGDGCNSTCQFEPAVWRRLQPAESPPARQQAAIAYDAQRGVAVLFGGGGNANYHYNDTWEWNGTTWTLRTPAVSPPARREAGMAYDAKRQRVVLFGGVNYASGGVLGDMWEWDGTTWTLLSPPTSPPARYGPAMVYDAAREVVVLAGGQSTIPFRDTWQWDGTTWTELAMTTPWFHRNAPIAYDGHRERVVLLGSSNSQSLDVTTSEWDALNWTQVVPQASPKAAEGRVMTYDAFRQRTILFGGRQGNSPADDTWSWDGTAFVELPAGGDGPPPARMFGAMVYDAARTSVLLFGGAAQEWGGGPAVLFGDTWEFR